MTAPASAAAVRFRLIAAPFTPFDAAGELDLSVIPRQAERLRRDRVAGAFVCGTTGEGMSLSLPERMAVAEAWSVAAQGLELFVHVGHSSLPDAESLATHAETIGCHAIAAIGPTFFAPTNPTALAAYFARIAERSSKPFYFYHIPSLMRVPYRASELLPLLIEQVPTFAGIKFTHEDLEDFRRCMAISEGRYRMLFGRDELLLSGLEAGAPGAVGSTYNYAAPIYQRVIAAFALGEMEEARRWQARATAFIRTFQQFGGLEAGKALMGLCGVECGPPRLPLEAMSSEAIVNLRQKLEEQEFFRDLG